MNEEPYKNREIREMFDDIKSTLLRIETQTTKTNGRVSSLEGSRNWVLGGAAVFVPIFVIVAGWLVTQQLEDSNVITDVLINKITTP